MAMGRIGLIASILSGIVLASACTRDRSASPSFPGRTYFIQYTGSLDLSRPEEVYDLDLFDTPPEVVDTLHRMGKIVVAYVNVGAFEDWRPDTGAFPPEVLGNAYEGWPGERWLDIRRLDLLGPIMERRLDLAVQKGFDGIHPDNMDGFENNTGFPLSRDDQIRYNRWIAEQAHRRGLWVAQKNVPSLAPDLAGDLDFAILESCFEEGWCDTFRLWYTDRGKPVFAIEYAENDPDTLRICAYSDTTDIFFLFKTPALDAQTWTCGERRLRR